MEAVVPFFRSLAENAGVRDILRLNREAGKALIHYHQAVLRQPSPLTAGERELIAAYVSALNSCHYCYGVHEQTARQFGLAPKVLESLVADLGSAPIDGKLLPLLRYVHKLTLSPSRLVRADADEVFAAGWTEQALHDAICVACLFNFMNRLLDGHGVTGDPALYQERGQALHKEGYSFLLRFLE
jgi:uncharacterized peroxidase-related enzyme